MVLILHLAGSIKAGNPLSGKLDVKMTLAPFFWCTNESVCDELRPLGYLTFEIEWILGLFADIGGYRQQYLNTGRLAQTVDSFPPCLILLFAPEQFFRA